MIRSRVGLVFSLSTLALGFLQQGCGSPDVEPLDEGASTSVAPAARTGFIALTPISVVPGSTALSPYAHVPSSPNGQSSFTRSVGCSVGAQGGTDAASASFSCSFQDSATVSLSDFTAIDQSRG